MELTKADLVCLLASLLEYEPNVDEPTDAQHVRELRRRLQEELNRRPQ